MKTKLNIYQIFVRNYSLEGTFDKVTSDLERIQELGMNVIYLMPIHEIGIKERKGTYGSPYAIKDYYSISADLGSLDDFKNLVNKTHELGMRIILDMVFNHTSRDNVLLNEHEDYYYHKNGKLSNRVGDWSDIIDLDTYKNETQSYLLDVLKYWVSLGVNGFRFDVASMIPLEFFKKARKELEEDILFIGESIDPGFASYLLSINDYSTPDDLMYPTFDVLYNYNYFPTFIKYLTHEADLNRLVNEINMDKLNNRLICLENHDNKRISSFLDKDKLIKWLDFFAFIKGEVFIYAGQEYGNKHKPELFEKDPIDHSHDDISIYNIYNDYITKKTNQKEIIYQHIDVIDIDKVKVTIKYNDNQVEEKEFILPR